MESIIEHYAALHAGGGVTLIIYNAATGERSTKAYATLWQLKEELAASGLHLRNVFRYD